MYDPQGLSVTPLPQGTSGDAYTQWSLFPLSRGGDEQEPMRALNRLCSQYHYPLYCYIRRR